MAFGILLLFFTRPAGIPTWLRNATIAGAALLLLFSGSATPLVATTVFLVAFPLLHVARIKTKRTLPLWVPLLPFFICLALVVVTGSALILEAVGRTSRTLTGRTPLWAAVVDASQVRPWLGYGYAIFWVGGMSGLAQRHQDCRLERAARTQRVPRHLSGFGICWTSSISVGCRRGVIPCTEIISRSHNTRGKMASGLLVIFPCV